MISEIRERNPYISIKGKPDTATTSAYTNKYATTEATLEITVWN